MRSRWGGGSNGGENEDNNNGRDHKKVTEHDTTYNDYSGEHEFSGEEEHTDSEDSCFVIQESPVGSLALIVSSFGALDSLIVYLRGSHRSFSKSTGRIFWWGNTHGRIN